MNKFPKLKTIKFLLSASLLLAAGTTIAQVGIGTSTPDASAQLDVNSANKGFLPPRMTQAQRNAISSPVAGLTIWCKNCGVLGELQVFNGRVWTNMIGGYPETPTAASITIGTQVWATKNLDVVTYRNGDTIPEVINPLVWDTLTSGAWCYYNNDPANGAIYGKLYNRAAVVDPRGLAPVGWHIPYDSYDISSGFSGPLWSGQGEWKTLWEYLGGTLADNPEVLTITSEADAAKMRATALWITPNSGTNNMSGFSALPGGQRNPDGSFIGMGSFARWWSAGVLLQGYYTGTTADVYSDYISPLLDSNKFDFKNSIHFKHTSSEAEPSITYYPAGYGFSIRCIKN